MRLLKEIQNLMGSYHVKSGMYHYYRNEYRQAVEFLRKALGEGDLSPADDRNARYYLTLSLLDLAQRLRDSGDVEGGVEQLRRAAEVSPDYPDIHFRLGQLLEAESQLDLAIEEYRQATTCQGDFLDAQVALAFCLLNRGKHDESAAAFRRALELKQGQIERPFQKGVELLEQGEVRDAAESFHEAFLAVPQLANARLKRALDWLKVEEHEKALAELDQAVDRNPKYPDLHNFRGVVLCELERTQEAIEAFRLSAALRPGYLVPRLNLAFALVRVGEYKGAEAELESILELDPEEPAATAMLEELRSGGPEKRRKASRGSSR